LLFASRRRIKEASIQVTPHTRKHANKAPPKMPHFSNLDQDAGLQELNGYLASVSYITGYSFSADDVEVFKRVPHNVNATKYPHVARWYRHIRAIPDYIKHPFDGDAKAAAPKPAKTPQNKPQTPQQKPKTPQQKVKTPKQEPEPAAEEEEAFTLGGDDDEDAAALEKLKEKEKEKEKDKQKKRKRATC